MKLSCLFVIKSETGSTVFFLHLGIEFEFVFLKFCGMIKASNTFLIILIHIIFYPFSCSRSFETHLPVT